MPASAGGPTDGPLDGGPLVWYRLNSSGTGVNGVFIFLQGRWQALDRNFGPTADRPLFPANLEQFYDEDISTMLIWERGAWRTVGGARGDLKYVSWPTAEQALEFNPGWEVYGTGETESVGIRGRLLVQATKNPGAGATTELTVTGGVSEKDAAALQGEEEHTLVTDELPTHSHTYDAATFGVGGGGGFTGISFPQSNVSGNTGGDLPHNNMPPTYAAWLLRKT